MAERCRHGTGRSRRAVHQPVGPVERLRLFYRFLYDADCVDAPDPEPPFEKRNSAAGSGPDFPDGLILLIYGFRGANPGTKAASPAQRIVDDGESRTHPRYGSEDTAPGAFPAFNALASFNPGDGHRDGQHAPLEGTEENTQVRLLHIEIKREVFRACKHKGGRDACLSRASLAAGHRYLHLPQS
ncbi:hypothetical protein SDC9_90288 [bioreactor metagenome]|uniref:Uncharacterized protein n=1 Tax=bioreactor metagenome TaxID=1076179 RepID=A0A644ZUP9_9ZZZZ